MITGSAGATRGLQRIRADLLGHFRGEGRSPGCGERCRVPSRPKRRRVPSQSARGFDPRRHPGQLKRVFGIDIETCPTCGRAVRIIACIEDAVVIEKNPTCCGLAWLLAASLVTVLGAVAGVHGLRWMCAKVRSVSKVRLMLPQGTRLKTRRRSAAAFRRWARSPA